MKLFKMFTHEHTHLHPVLRHLITYRYILFSFIFITMVIDKTVYTGDSFTAIYGFTMVILGLIYKNNYQMLFNSFLVVISRYFLTTEGIPDDYEVFIFQWLTFFLIGFSVSTLIKHHNLQRKNEFQIRKLAFHDSLTGLPNRYQFESQLKECFEEHEVETFSLLFIDIDRFKIVNDTYGHCIGDDLLKSVANRLISVLRKQDVISRHGGDEFLILIKDLDTSALSSIATRILESFSKPFLLSNNEKVHVSPSIGISIYPDNGKDALNLIKNADTAMYLAKDNGKNTYKFYSEATQYLSEKSKLEMDLNQALEKNEFVLYYQPQVELSSSKTIGFESLLRWHHPKKGIIPPSDFIPILENSNNIISVGKWVLEEACKQLYTWHKKGYTDLKIAVNISAKQFNHHSFVNDVMLILDKVNLSPHYLEIEITESLIKDITRTKKTIEELRKIGIKVSFDDFGSGYSSLSHLHTLPIDFVKLDKSFLETLKENNSSSKLIKSICEISNHLNFDIIVEGIENAEQYRILNDIGCQYGQGFFIERPLPPSDLEHFLLKKAN